MTFLECIERRKIFFIGYAIGYVAVYGIMEAFGFSVAPITGLTIFGIALGVLLVAPAVEYYWQENEKLEI